MSVTSLAGFQNPVHDAQLTFRALLDALARPGQPCAIPASIGTLQLLLQAPPGLTPAFAAACLSLLDQNTTVWLQPGFHSAVKPWLTIHTNCLFSDRSHADFALIRDGETLPLLSVFNGGSAEQPEHSTTVFIQVDDFCSGQPVALEGPGILQVQAIAPQGLPPWFWAAWMTNVQSYPQGVDIFFFTHNAVMGLPRTSKARLLTG